MDIIRPERLWRLSIRLHRRRWSRLARLVKALNFVLYKALLPIDAEVGPGLRLSHHALAVVIHPNTTIGRDVRIYHGVTIASETWIGSPNRVHISDRVMIGAGAKIIARINQPLSIGHDAKIGANAVVTHDVPPGATMIGVPARAMNVIQSERLGPGDDHR